MKRARGLQLDPFAIAVLIAVMTIAVAIMWIARLDAGISTTPGLDAREPSASESRRATPAVSGATSLNASPTASHRATPNLTTPYITAAGPRTITGMVYELDAYGSRRPVGGVSVAAYVFAYGRGTVPWMTDVTDPTGHYELWGRPRGATVISAVKQSYVPPCAVVTGDEVHDIEIVPTSMGGAAATAAAQRGGTPFLTGIVYEQRADGARVPVANAAISLGSERWVLAATTVTDDLRRYLLCSVPALPDSLFVTVPGYTALVPSTCTGDECWNIRLGDITILDVEMKR